MNNPAAPLEAVFGTGKNGKKYFSKAYQFLPLHKTLTHLSVSSAERYEAEAPVIMDVVKYLLRQKQQLVLNKEKIASTPVVNPNLTPAPTLKPTIITEPPKVPSDPTQKITDANGRFTSNSKQDDPENSVDAFLNQFEMPGKFAMPDRVAPKKANTSSSTSVQTTVTVIKTEKPKDVIDSEATILYDSPELAAAAANGAAAVQAPPKKRKLDDSDEGGSKTKKARLESTPQDLFDFLRKSGMKEVIALQIRRSKHEAAAEWGEFNSTVQFKLSNKFAATPAALLDLFLQEKELENTTKINAWTHLFLDEDLILNAPQIFEKTAFGHIKKFKFARGTKIDTIRGMLFFAKEIEKKAALGSLEDLSQLIFKTVNYATFCTVYGS